MNRCLKSQDRSRKKRLFRGLKGSVCRWKPALDGEEDEFFGCNSPEVFGSGWLPCILIMVLIGLWDTQVLINVRYPAFWSLHCFGPDCPAVDPGVERQWVTPGIHLDNLGVQEVADSHSSSESVSLASLCDDLDEGFRPMKNRSGYSASPWYTALDADLLDLTLAFYSHIEFCDKGISALLALYSAKHSNIHVWGSKHGRQAVWLFVSLTVCSAHGRTLISPLYVNIA